MEKISTQLIQAQSYVAILTQSSDGMVQMAARMIEQALKSIGDELKHNDVPKGRVMTVPEGRPIDTEAKPKHPPMVQKIEHVKGTKGGSQKRLSFSYGAYIDDDKFYSCNDMATMLGVTYPQFAAVYEKYCTSIKHDFVQGKRTMMFSGSSFKRIRDIIKKLYGYNEAVCPEIREYLNESIGEDNYLYEYSQKKKAEEAKLNPPKADPEWPDPMPDCLKDEDDE